MVVYALWERAAWVRFPAARQASTFTFGEPESLRSSGAALLHLKIKPIASQWTKLLISPIASPKAKVSASGK